MAWPPQFRSRNRQAQIRLTWDQEIPGFIIVYHLVGGSATPLKNISQAAAVLFCQRRRCCLFGIHVFCALDAAMHANTSDK